MVRREEDLPRIIDEKKQFEPASPLHRIVEIVLPIVVGTMPPPFASPSLITDFLGLAVPTALNCRSTSEEMVTVCRNMTWPTSTVTFGAALTAAARAAAPDEKPCPPSSP